MRFYVFRIDEGNERIISEIKQGILRQGWGAKGMSVLGSYEDYLDGWKSKWGTIDPDDNPKGKYRNISIMKEMEPEDLIVIPKVTLRKDMIGHSSFTIVRVTGHYRFEPLVESNDFGHIIPVEYVMSCPYEANSSSRKINKKMRAYQSPVNNCWNSEFCDSVTAIISEYASDPNSDIIEKSEIEAISTSGISLNHRTEYLKALVDQINGWSGRNLEKLIVELFEKNNYRVVRTNNYDGKGADVDIEMVALSEGTLGYDLFTMNESGSLPKICIQAKNKAGRDTGDKEGVNQLIQSKSSNPNANISYVLINLAKDFTEGSQELARKNGIALINGIEFASLLVKYGVDACVR